MQLRNKKIVVCGAGGFIGGHLVEKLIGKGWTSSAPLISSR